VEPGPGLLRVFGLSAVEVGDLAYEAGVRVHGLLTREASLEQAYLELTGEAVEYMSGEGVR
jgi:ABC-2 type transport system ATP-binding protein